MRLFLIRHAESVANARGCVQGQSRGGLLPTGFRQAEALAQRLHAQGLALLFSSDLERYRQTADPIARACGLAVRYDTRLRERDFGRFEGLPAHPLLIALRRAQRAAGRFNPEGGESAARFEAQIREVARDHLMAPTPVTMGMVTDAGVVETLVRELTGPRTRPPQKRLSRGPGAVTELRRCGRMGKRTGGAFLPRGRLRGGGGAENRDDGSVGA